MVRRFPPYGQAIPSIETMGYILIHIYYGNKEVKCDVNDTKHCNLLNGDTALLLNILQLPKEKLKVNNVLNESNNIKHIPKRIDKITNHYKDDILIFK